TSTATRVPAPERGEARAVRTAGPEPAEDPQRPRQQPVARDRSGISRPANQREILITGGPPGRPAAHPSPKRHRGRSRPLAETASISWSGGESTPGPARCERVAVPTPLQPLVACCRKHSKPGISTRSAPPLARSATRRPPAGRTPRCALPARRTWGLRRRSPAEPRTAWPERAPQRDAPRRRQIGRASCREREWAAMVEAALRIDKQ